VAEALPAGVVTFLFTDIEGSTKLWERCPEAMRASLPDHDAILRDAIERNKGVVFKTMGDAFCAAFGQPRMALAAAIEGQRALHAHAWPPELGGIRVRMGVHCGECAQRGGDYYGPTLNRVARLASVGHGEQILLSAATAALLRDSLEGDVALRDLGLVRLKDLSQPESTFQVLAPGLRSTFPAPLSLDSRPNNLPSQISTFIGRESELEQLGFLIADARLLTITGPGGIGKTRLALQLAASVVEQYADGAWFADLSTIRNPELIAQAIAAVLGIRELPSEPIEVTLIAHVRDKKLLLVIDNAEHLLAGVARFVKSLLSQCPGVTVVATSRQPLHVSGEQVYRLGPLAESTRLFLDRAQQAAPSTVFGDAENADVDSLCAKLEGLPLAIELACARLSSMPLKQLARRLKSGLTLSSKDSTESSRHRTLRETIAWSFELLEPDERDTFTALSVFHGGCTAEAIDAVAHGTTEVDDVLDSLVDKSLLQVEDTGSVVRYRLLEAVREFAYERLQGDAAAERSEFAHADYYADLVASAHARASKGDLSDYTTIDSDAPNVRAALEWLFPREILNAVRLLSQLAPYWRLRGNLAEARSWISRALDVCTGDNPNRVPLLCLAASFATLQDELAESLRLANEALDLARAAGDGTGTAWALFRIAEARHRQGQLDAAEALYREALTAFRSSPDARAEMLCLGNLGMLARQRGDLHDAVELLDDAIHRATRLGERRLLGEFTMQMGWVQIGLNDLAQSRTLFEKAFSDKSDDRDRYGVCCARHGLATVALKEARPSEALEEFVATLNAAMELQLKDYVARAFHGIAAVEAIEGRTELGQRLLGLADRIFEESGRVLRDSVAYDVASHALEAALPPDRQSALREEGARMSVADALAAVQTAGERVEAP
jgi:predicted ATPase/class 3 adenylate cyclase